MRLRFKKSELVDLIKAWFAISLAFGILSTSLLRPLGLFNGFLVAFSISLVTAGFGFVVHELSHKFVAQKFYCSAEFKSNDLMLVFAVLMSFAGFIFAAPGAVIINGSVNKKQNGLISVSGPFSNFVLALLFLPGFFLFSGLLRFFFFQGFFINSWLGLFNMIPFIPFDGVHVFKWNKLVYFLLAGFLLVLVFVGFSL
ncbi:metalloprotease [Candidatus Woesearchaeota archaeon]|nr:metalloprotease [Candidatus Woesearchaeota archaeon]